MEKNRIAQRIRDRRKRLHLDIQTQITRQVPETIEKLWDLYHLDIQAQIPLQSPESTFLFTTLPCVDTGPDGQAMQDKGRWHL